MHPELERARQEAVADRDTGHVSLPDHDPHRPFVFWDLTVENKPAGAAGGGGCGRRTPPLAGPWPAARESPPNTHGKQSAQPPAAAAPRPAARWPPPDRFTVRLTV